MTSKVALQVDRLAPLIVDKPSSNSNPPSLDPTASGSSSENTNKNTEGDNNSSSGANQTDKDKSSFELSHPRSPILSPAEPTASCSSSSLSLYQSSSSSSSSPTKPTSPRQEEPLGGAASAKNSTANSLSVIKEHSSLQALSIIPSGSNCVFASGSNSSLTDSYLVPFGPETQDQALKKRKMGNEPDYHNGGSTPMDGVELDSSTVGGNNIQPARPSNSIRIRGDAGVNRDGATSPIEQLAAASATAPTTINSTSATSAGGSSSSASAANTAGAAESTTSTVSNEATAVERHMTAASQPRQDGSMSSNDQKKLTVLEEFILSHTKQMQQQQQQSQTQQQQSQQQQNGKSQASNNQLLIRSFGDLFDDEDLD